MRTILIGLPISVYTLSVAVSFRRVGSLRVACLVGGIWCGVLLAIVTEALSALHLLSPAGVELVWTLVAAILAVALWRSRMSYSGIPGLSFSKMDSGTAALLACTSLIVALVLVAACVAPPNVWDCMEYHLPRVAQWALRGSVDLYPTPDYQQLMAPPFAEWAMLHLQLLSGGDRFASLVQVGSFVLSAISASLIGKSLGASALGQELAATLCVTIPQGVLSASGAKNDWVVALWLSSAVALLLELRNGYRWLYVTTAFAGIGLACLTKGTGYVLAPFLILGCLLQVWQRTWKIPYRAALAGLLLAMAINLPQYVRNYRLSDSPLGFDSPDGSSDRKWRNEGISPKLLAVNVIKNAALHLGTPISSLNAALTSSIRHGIVAMGVNPDYPAVTWNHNRFSIGGMSKHEIFAGNPLHLLLCLVTFVLMWAKTSRSRDWWIYGASVLAALLVFCTLFKWQAFSARFHLPLFVLMMALSSAVLSRRVSKTLCLRVGITFSMIAIPYALFNALRPMVSFTAGVHGRLNWGPSIFTTPRELQYFQDQHPQLAGSYIRAVNSVKATHCKRVGVDVSQQHYEYPLFALLDASEQDTKSWYTNVTNRSSRFKTNLDTQPMCAVICPNCRSNEEQIRRYSTVFETVTAFEDVLVFSNTK